jgi:uncharacterized protein YbdZ (MbtH family)
MWCRTQATTTSRLCRNSQMVQLAADCEEFHWNLAGRGVISYAVSCSIPTWRTDLSWDVLAGMTPSRLERPWEPGNPAAVKANRGRSPPMPYREDAAIDLYNRRFSAHALRLFQSEPARPDGAWLVAGLRCRRVRRVLCWRGDLAVGPTTTDRHSLWPVFADVPAGWTVVHGPVGCQECLDYVEASWTDMRPRSLVERVG